MLGGFFKFMCNVYVLLFYFSLRIYERSALIFFCFLLNRIFYELIFFSGSVKIHGILKIGLVVIF